MRDDYQLEEMSGAVGLGLLASDLVLAAGKVLRAAALSKSDRATLDLGRRLLEALSAPLDDLPLIEGLGHLSSKNSTLDAIQAMQGRFPGEDIAEHVVPLADALRAVLEAESGRDERDTAGARVAEQYADRLREIRDLFASIGEAEVTRVTNLARPRQDVPPWQTSTASFAS